MAGTAPCWARGCDRRGRPPRDRRDRPHPPRGRAGRGRGDRAGARADARADEKRPEKPPGRRQRRGPPRDGTGRGPVSRRSSGPSWSRRPRIRRRACARNWNRPRRTPPRGSAKRWTSALAAERDRSAADLEAERLKTQALTAALEEAQAGPPGTRGGAHAAASLQATQNEQNVHDAQAVIDARVAERQAQLAVVERLLGCRPRD